MHREKRWVFCVYSGIKPAMTETVLHTDFAGRRWRLFWLAFRTGLLTILTLGFYRFWMRTRLRRWYWSAVRPGGHPLEYVGAPLEKLLGFLVAVVVLAFYIGIVNLLLMFASFSIFEGASVAYGASFLGVIPLWFFARYRARRYILARTRWRGVRFGLAPGAWGYAWRAIMHWLITILTLGLLWPRMTFWLEKYRTDRSFFGTQRFAQGGRWTMLWRATLHVWIPLLLAAGLGLALLAEMPTEAATLEDPYTDAVVDLPLPLDQRLLLFIPLTFWALYGIVHYRVRSFEILTRHKSLGGVSLAAEPNPRRVLWIGLSGYVLVLLAIALPVTPVVGALVFVEVSQMVPADALDVPRWALAALGALLYFLIFLMWSTLTHVFVTLPLTRHYATRFTVQNPAALAQIDQRARDEFAEAEGFADALDVGAAI